MSPSQAQATRRSRRLAAPVSPASRATASVPQTTDVDQRTVSINVTVVQTMKPGLAKTHHKNAPASAPNETARPVPSPSGPDTFSSRNIRQAVQVTAFSTTDTPSRRNSGFGVIQVQAPPTSSQVKDVNPSIRSPPGK